jgi:hypothetical protein
MMNDLHFKERRFTNRRQGKRGRFGKRPSLGEISLPALRIHSLSPTLSGFRFPVSGFLYA